VRRTFAKVLTDLAERDARIILLTGDLGYTVLEPFCERFPSRFFNMGVAEQNMLGAATGLAEAGFIPFVYSIVTFASLRSYEFIRNGPIFHQLPVRIVGVGAGFEYGNAGPSHYGLEDLGLMRIQPGITVIAPADYEQANAALQATWDSPRPVYYRLSKDDSTTVAGLNGKFELGRAQLIREGSDLAMIAVGPIAGEVAAAAEILATRGVSCTVAVVASFNPAPTDDLIRILSTVPLAITVEAHYVDGGIGSLVSEVVAEHGLRCRVVRCGVRTMPVGVCGSQDYQHRRHGLSSAALVETALSELQSIRR
jgi:transketolase